jgi:hypothetical protein
MLSKNERYAKMSSDGWVVVLLVASDCLKNVMKYVEAIVRRRQSCGYVRCELRLVQRRHHLRTRTVVGWKAGVVARLRADVEVGSVIGRAWMVETAYRSQWMRSTDAKRLCTTYHDYNSNVPGKSSYE